MSCFAETKVTDEGHAGEEQEVISWEGRNVNSGKDTRETTPITQRVVMKRVTHQKAPSASQDRQGVGRLSLALGSGVQWRVIASCR